MEIIINEQLVAEAKENVTDERGYFSPDMIIAGINLYHSQFEAKQSIQQDKVQIGDYFELDGKIYQLENEEDARWFYDKEQKWYVNHIWNLSPNYKSGKEVRANWKKVQINLPILIQQDKTVVGESVEEAAKKLYPDDLSINGQMNNPILIEPLRQAYIAGANNHGGWSDKDMIKFFQSTNDKIVTRTISDEKCKQFLAEYKANKGK